MTFVNRNASVSNWYARPAKKLCKYFLCGKVKKVDITASFSRLEIMSLKKESTFDWIFSSFTVTTYVWYILHSPYLYIFQLVTEYIYVELTLCLASKTEMLVCMYILHILYDHTVSLLQI